MIDTSKIYYLGSYLTKKIPPLKRLNFQIAKGENDNVEKIYEQMKKRSSNWSEIKIDYEQSLFKVDTTNIEIKNNR